jgi:predicted acylesterase/phospholipase RssA
VRKTPEINNLVFGGGGTKGGSLPGAMEVVQSRASRKNIKRCAGTSIGAIYATLYSFGKTNEQIKEILGEKQLSDFIDGLSEHGHQKLTKGLNKANYGKSFFAAKTLKGAKSEIKSNLNEHLGISNSKAISLWLQQVGLRELGIKDVTFQDLKDKHDKDPEKYKLLYVVATNLSTGRAVVLSHENVPNMVVASATCASAAFPGAFQPVTLLFRAEDGKTYKDPHGYKFTDGGIAWNCALTLFDEARFIPGNAPGDRTPIINPHTLAMRYVDAGDKDYYSFGGDIPVRPLDNLYELTTTLMLATFLQQETAMDTPENCARTIQIDNLGISTFEVQLSGNKLDALVDSGRVSAQQFFGLLTRDEALEKILKLRQTIKEIREDDKPAVCVIV